MLIGSFKCFKRFFSVFIWELVVQKSVVTAVAVSSNE